MTGEVRHEEWHPLIPEERVARILFSRPGYSSLALVKEGKAWKVDTLSGVTADGQKIQALIERLNGLKAELRAEGEDLYDRFSISDQKAFHVQVLDAAGSAIVDFYMGSQRAGQGVFIRLAGQSKIYFAPDDLPAALGLFADIDRAGPQGLFFADLKLVPESFEQIQRFETAAWINSKKETRATLERASVAPGADWKIVDGSWKFSIGADKVEAYLTRVVGAHAESIAVNIPEFKNESEMMLRDERGKVVRLLFSKAKTGWLMKRENSPVVFEVSNGVYEDLQAEDAHFITDNPLQFQLDDAYAVELIHEGKTEKFTKESGWASAVAIVDAAMRLRFLSFERGVSAQDLSVLPPTHQMRVIYSGKQPVEIGFYLTDAKLTEIKTVISGQTQVFKVSRDFFDSIFVPVTPPAAEPDAVPNANLNS